MPAYTYPAHMYQDSNRLAGIGHLGFQMVTDYTNEAIDAVKQKQQSGVWTNIANGITDALNSDTFKGLVKTGFEYDTVRRDRKAAEDMAAISRQKAALANRMAQMEIQDAKKEQAEMERLLKLEAQARFNQAMTPPATSGGGSDWLIPAALAGGGALVLFMMMRKRN